MLRRRLSSCVGQGLRRHRHGVGCVWAAEPLLHPSHGPEPANARERETEATVESD